MLTYNFSNIGSDSLYEYLYKCIKNDILLGNIRPGEKLPSKRTFAKNLGISVITVENAYAQLVAEGYLYSMPKRGESVPAAHRAAATQTKRDPAGGKRGDFLFCGFFQQPDGQRDFSLHNLDADGACCSE